MSFKNLQNKISKQDKNARTFCTVSLKVRQRDLERGLGVKITSDSVITREGMRGDVPRIDFHFTSRAE